MLEEKFVDFTTDSTGTLRKVVVNTRTGEHRFVPTDTKKRFVDFVHGKRVVYNPVSGEMEYEPVGKNY